MQQLNLKCLGCKISVKVPYLKKSAQAIPESVHLALVALPNHNGETLQKGGGGNYYYWSKSVTKNSVITVV